MKSKSMDFTNGLGDYGAVLQTTPLFVDVPPEVIRTALGRCTVSGCQTGEVILRPDKPNDRMFVILSGRVGVHLDSVETPPIATLGPGECVGEMSLFDGKAPSAFVRVAEPSSLLRIEASLLWDLIDESHDIARNLLRILSARLRASNLALTEVQKEKQEHERAALRDGLTGLHNRSWLEAVVSGVQGDSLVEYLPLGVVMLDVDRFKRVNDEFGHPTGDVVLQRLACFLRDHLRPSDMVARYGGEEFILLLPRTGKAACAKLAERLRKQIEEGLRSADGAPFPTLTVSAGIAVCTVSRTIQDAIRDADAALYRAKREGRNRVCG